MKNLLEFLARYNHTLLFVALEVVCAVLIFRYNSYQGSVYISTANAVAGTIGEWDSAVTTFFSLSKNNRELCARNVELEQTVRQLEDELQALQGDTTAARRFFQQSLAANGTTNDYRLIPARVVTNTTHKPDNLITLNKGRADGVRTDMGVVSGTGVVGVVYLVSEHYSLVIPILNYNSNISVAIRKRGYHGRVAWTGGSSRYAYVNDIPRHAKFNLYDTVETSGYSSIFPPGLAVGKILHVYNSADGLSYRAKIHLAADFGTLRDVCVIDNTALQERINLMQAATDSLRRQKR